MGRKINGHKHRGIRDPEKQQATRRAFLAQKINCPPKDNDEQAIPKSLLRIQELQRKMLKSTNAIEQRKTKLNSNERQIGIFKRRKGETDKFFLNRVHKQTEQVLKEAKFSDKYNVDIIRNKSNGKVERLQKRPKDQLDAYLRNIKKDNGSTVKNKKNQKKDEPKLTKSQKRRQKLLIKKQKYMENKLNVADEDNQIQKPAFAEIAHTPPTLTLPRIRNKNDYITSKPGQRNLLLKSFFNARHNDGKVNKGGGGCGGNSAPVNKKGPRKDLPDLLRQQLESNQNAAIDAYIQIKAMKYKDK